MILPILTQFFLDIYGWRGAILLLCGLVCHSVPCGALLTCMKKNTDETNKPLIRHTEQHSEENKDINKYGPFRNVARALGLQLFAKVSFVSQVLVPGFVWGYTITGWMIYMVSFAVSKGLSVREGSIVASSGGIGVIAIRIAIPLLHKVMTYKQIMYASSVLIAISLSLTTMIDNYIALNVISVIYGLGNGALGVEVYISAKINSEESEYFYAVSWLHMANGLASILTGFVTGKYREMSAKYCTQTYSPHNNYHPPLSKYEHDEANKHTTTYPHPLPPTPNTHICIKGTHLQSIIFHHFLFHSWLQVCSLT